MALSPEQIAEMEKVTGLKYAKPSVAAPTGKSRADEIRARFAAQKPIEKPSFFSRVGKDLKESGVQAKEQLLGQGEYATHSPVRRGAELVETAVETPLKVAGEAVSSVIPDVAKEAVGKSYSALPEGLQHPIDWLGGIIGDQKAVQDLVQKHPGASKFIEELAGTIAPIANTALDVAGATTGVGAFKTIAKNTPEMIDATVSATKRGLETAKSTPVGEMAASGYQKAKDIGSATKRVVTGVGLEKTPAEILATPESQAHKLSAAEREYYKSEQKKNLDKQFEESGNVSSKEFDAKRNALEAEHAAIEARTKSELAAITTKAENDISEMSQKIDTTGYNKTVELKPKAVKALGEQSDTYRKLIEEDLAPHKDVKVEHTEISDVVKNALPDNPAMAEKIINQIGVAAKETPGVIQLKVPTIKIGDLYQKIKGIKQQTSKPGLRGSRVYTAEDMARDKVLGELGNLLKEKGVDLSRANDFWRQWAPLRDKIVTKLKPFDKGNFETKTFSNILKESGSDIHNKNFISAFENVLGEKITGEMEKALSNLSKAEKSKLAAEIDAKTKLEDAKLVKKYKLESLSAEEQAAKTSIMTAKDAAKEALKEKQYNIERLAARRTIIRRTIGAIASLAGYEAVKNTVAPWLPGY